MKQWKIEVVGQDEKSVIKHIKALLATFELSAKINEPLHHADFSDKDTSLKCERKRKYDGHRDPDFDKQKKG